MLMMCVVPSQNGILGEMPNKQAKPDKRNKIFWQLCLKRLV